jgi:polysaccharide export outer membrane protein
LISFNAYRTRLRRLGALLTLSVLPVLAGCGSSATLSSLEGSSQETASYSAGSAPAAIKPTSQKASQDVARIFEEYSIPDSGGTAAEYLIAPMDVLEVTVFEAPNLSRTAQVSAAGQISLPLIKDVKAAGKTTDELQQEVATRLQRDYMQSPQVFVAVKEYNSQRVTVDGAVKNPGVFPLKGEMTLMQGLALAGGLNDMASTSGIYILRKSDGKKLAARFDLKEIRTGKKDDPVLKTGDIVIVDESGGKVALRGLREAMKYTSLFNLLML